MGSRRESERSRNMLTSKLSRKITWVQYYRTTSGEGKVMSYLRVVLIRARELGYTCPELIGIWLNVGLKHKFPDTSSFSYVVEMSCGM